VPPFAPPAPPYVPGKAPRPPPPPTTGLPPPPPPEGIWIRCGSFEANTVGIQNHGVNTECNSNRRYIDAIRIQRMPGPFDPPLGTLEFVSVGVYGVEHANRRGVKDWNHANIGQTAPMLVSGNIANPITPSSSGRSDSWTSCSMYESEGILGSLDAASDALASADTCCTDAPQQYDEHLYRCVSWDGQTVDDRYHTQLATHLGEFVKTPSDCMRKCTSQDHSHTLMCNAVTTWIDTRNNGIDHCILLHLEEEIYNDIPAYCTGPFAQNDVWKTYRYNPALVTTTCSSGATATANPYFEGILAHRTQISSIKVIPKPVAGSTSGQNELAKYVVSYRLHPNQSPWTHLGTKRCYPQGNSFGHTDAIWAEATPLTAANAAECRTLTERHPLILGHVPDMYRFHPTLGAENCVPQKMHGATTHPLFYPV
jgi:hypothetical protein